MLEINCVWLLFKKNANNQKNIEILKMLGAVLKGTNLLKS